MISVNGFIVDARTMPPEVQAEAPRRGLISELPAAQTNAGGDTPVGAGESHESRGATGGNMVTDAKRDVPSLCLAEAVCDVVDTRPIAG